MLRRGYLGIVLFLVMCLLGWPTLGRADRKEDAAKLADHGDRAFSKSDFKSALDEYKASYEKYPKPFLLFRIGECQRQLGLDSDALETYRKYLAKVTRGADRKKADSYATALQQKLDAAAAVEQPPPPPTPAVQAPDVEAPPMRETEIAAQKGKHKKKKGERDGPPPITTASDPKEDVRPPGYDPNAPVDPTPIVADVAPSGPRPIYKRWWFWTAIAGGAVVLGVGLGVGLTVGRPSFASELPVGGPGASALSVHF